MAAIAVAGVGLLCISSSVASVMVYKGGDKEDTAPATTPTAAEKVKTPTAAEKAQAKADALTADPDATPAEVAAAQIEADNAAAAAAAASAAAATPDDVPLTHTQALAFGNYSTLDSRYKPLYYDPSDQQIHYAESHGEGTAIFSGILPKPPIGTYEAGYKIWVGYNEAVPHPGPARYPFIGYKTLIPPK